jgi:outer membrane receptor for ferrienterochelin and colicin
MRRITLLLLISAVGYSTSIAQEVQGIVSGKLPENKSETLVGASVFWTGTQSGTTTDANGRYKLQVPQGAVSLVFSYIGYAPDTVEYTGQNLINVLLKPIQIGEAEVVAERASTELSLMNPLNTQKITEKELGKAACCNLSESFETNASVDASFTDAVTGTAQIRMLGLDGKYTQMMADVVPQIRGLSVIYGLSAIPGPWIESIQIGKGVGSVSNGYESITGQINVSMKNPHNAEKLYINAYGNQGGRMELNASYLIPVNPAWSTIVQAHSEINNIEQDMNHDGFMDNPLKRDAIFRNSWTYRSKVSGWEGEYQITGTLVENASGEMSDRHEDMNHEFDPWKMKLTDQNLNAYAKTGYLFEGTTWKSIGTQFSGTYQDLNANYGLRQYQGLQESLRANLLYASKIGETTDHTFMTGLSFQSDVFTESLDSLSFERAEYVPGAFFEYTWKHDEVFTLIAGVRVDEHNLFGTFFSPRLHARYSLTENTSLKLALGKGYRTSNVLMEHVGILASNRVIEVNGVRSGFMPNLQPEEAWNAGLNLTKKFNLNYREASFTVDLYRTEFMNQAVLDLETPGIASFYNLNGSSWSNSAQLEFNWTPVRRVEMRLSYRWLEVRTDFASGLLDKPMVSRHRAFSNFAWESKENAKKGKWKFDITPQWIGSSRIPDTSANPEAYRLKSRSDDYVLLHSQITRVFNPNFEVYLGAENLTNFMQQNPIIGSADPRGEYFDASLVWGPVFGRMVYAGLRFKIL